jgi:hypothetical protein
MVQQHPQHSVALLLKYKAKISFNPASERHHQIVFLIAEFSSKSAPVLPTLRL